MMVTLTEVTGYEKAENSASVTSQSSEMIWIEFGVLLTLAGQMNLSCSRYFA